MNSRHLGDVLRRLGPEIVADTSGSGDLETPVNAVVVAEPEVDPAAGDMVVAVNIAPASAEAAALILRAEEHRAAAVIFKPAAAELPALHTWSPAALTLVAVRPEVSWQRLLALLESATVEDARAGNYWGDNYIGDLFALAQATAVAIGGAVSVMDRHGRVLAYSSVDGQEIDSVRRDGILGRRVPEHFLNAHLNPRVRESASAQYVDTPGALPRLAVAVRAGHEVLGTLWAVIPGAGLKPDADAILASAAQVATLFLLQYASTSSAITWRARADFVRGQLLGTVAPDDTEPGTTSRLVVAAVRPSELTIDADAVRLEQIAGLLAVICGRWISSGVTIVDDTVFALLPLARGDQAAAAIELARTVAARVHESFGFDVSIGLSEPHSSAQHARSEAQETLAILTEHRRPAVSVYGQVRTKAAFSRLAGVLDNADFTIAAADELLDHDRLHDTSYADTVLAWLESGTNVAAAAQALHLHPNTYRYRMRRAEKLFSLELEDPDARLMLWIGLRLRSRHHR